jgi:glycerophosphoryl diester phosphodiesterase
MRLQQEGRVLRIGHRGAPALAPANTLASIAAAIEHGVDLVEMDVIAEGGTLRLAHSVRERVPASPSLSDSLALVADRGAGVVLDLKSPGIESGVVDALRRHGLVERSLVTSFHGRRLRLLKKLDPRLSTGLSYPLDRVGIAERPLFQPLIRAGLVGLRRTLPARIGRMLARARADAAVLHYALVTPLLVERCHARGAAVLAWTVEDEETLRLALAAGVDGVIANDPRLFDA